MEDLEHFDGIEDSWIINELDIIIRQDEDMNDKYADILLMETLAN